MNYRVFPSGFFCQRLTISLLYWWPFLSYLVIGKIFVIFSQYHQNIDKVTAGSIQAAFAYMDKAFFGPIRVLDHGSQNNFGVWKLFTQPDKSDYTTSVTCILISSFWIGFSWFNMWNKLCFSWFDGIICFGLRRKSYIDVQIIFHALKLGCVSIRNSDQPRFTCGRI